MFRVVSDQQAVYNGWKASKFSNPWCFENFIHTRAMKTAQDVRKRKSRTFRYIFTADAQNSSVSWIVTNTISFLAARTTTASGWPYVRASSAMLPRKVRLDRRKRALC